MGTTEVVVITGASAGVGRATAQRFALRGACVALLARGRAGLEAAAREVERLGGQALPLVCDVADAEQVEAAAAQVEEHLGPVDIWINNAMVTVFSPLERLTPEELRRVTDVNYHGAVHGTLAALRRMRARGRGTIVQVSSALAFRGIPLQAAYCGSKFALRGFTESLRCELLREHSRIHVAMVHLGAMNTPQFQWARSRLPRHPQPVPPIYQPEVAADAIYWAAHHRRRDLWVGRATAMTIIGNRVAPWLLDRMLANKAYEGQMTDEAVDARAGNLDRPVDQEHGAHGRFDAQAGGRSVQLKLSQYRLGLVAGMLALALVATPFIL